MYSMYIYIYICMYMYSCILLPCPTDGNGGLIASDRVRPAAPRGARASFASTSRGYVRR